MKIKHNMLVLALLFISLSTACIWLGSWFLYGPNGSNNTWAEPPILFTQILLLAGALFFSYQASK